MSEEASCGLIARKDRERQSGNYQIGNRKGTHCTVQVAPNKHTHIIKACQAYIMTSIVKDICHVDYPFSVGTFPDTSLSTVAEIL